MTDKQPEALRRADMLENWNYKRHSDLLKAAAELRRLHEVNAGLVEALEKIEEIVSPYRDGVKFNYIADIAQAALAKAQGDNNENAPTP